MATHRNHTHEQKYPQPANANKDGVGAIPGDPIEGNASASGTAQQGAVTTKEATDAEAQRWDDKKDTE